MGIIADLLGRKQRCMKDIELSEEAQMVRNSPLVSDFFDKAEAAILSRWKDTPDDAIEARERLYLMNGMLRNFKSYFETFVINGQFAQHQLDEIIREEAQSIKNR
jgi:hypothetical protein